MDSLSVNNHDYFDIVFDLIEEAVQIVDCNGINIYYNQAAEEMDGLKRDDVIGKHILQVYPSLTLETSSLLQVLETEKPILNQQQSIVSSSGKAMTILYYTYPLYRNGNLIGACDISRDITKIKELSERVMELQAELMDSKSSSKRKSKS
ncbi:MAG: PAS domain S-box protein, partial [Dehalobacterium sp.]